MSSANGANVDARRRARIRRLLAAYFVFSGLALVWPLHGWLGNHVEPRVLGLPWSFAYVLAIVVANFGVLAFAYRRRWIDDDPRPGSDGHG